MRSSEEIRVRRTSDIKDTTLVENHLLRQLVWENTSNPFMMANDHKQIYVMYLFVLIQIIFSTNFFGAQIKLHN